MSPTEKEKEEIKASKTSVAMSLGLKFARFDGNYQNSENRQELARNWGSEFATYVVLAGPNSKLPKGVNFASFDQIWR